MISESIASLGYELECGVSSEKRFQKVKDKYATMTYGRDGSVWVEQELEDIPLDFGDHINRSAEITYWSEKKEEIYTSLKDLFAIPVKTNNSCGFHIHVKFVNLKLGSYMTSTLNFQKHFMEQYNETFKSTKYRSRLENQYSRFTQYDAVRVIEQYFTAYRNGSRYWAINLNSFPIRKTVEFRIFPYPYNAEEAKKMIEFLIGVCDKEYRTVSYKHLRKFNSKELKVIV
ncbi:MAG: amidoligase family protein [Candidatus Parvarchaeum sp.]